MLVYRSVTFNLEHHNSGSLILLLLTVTMEPIGQKPTMEEILQAHLGVVYIDRCISNFV